MEKKYFEIKPEHLKLLKNMEVGWQDVEFGAPEIDPKRPYGNSDVHRDILEIVFGKDRKLEKIKSSFYGVNIEIDLDDMDELPEELTNKLEKLHKETETVLQICLRTGKFETGVFECEKYSSDWIKREIRDKQEYVANGKGSVKEK